MMLKHLFTNLMALNICFTQGHKCAYLTQLKLFYFSIIKINNI